MNSLKTLSSQIYSATARIVFELIQNADDCTFADDGRLRELHLECDEWRGDEMKPEIWKEGGDAAARHETVRRHAAHESFKEKGKERRSTRRRAARDGRRLRAPPGLVRARARAGRARPRREAARRADESVAWLGRSGRIQ